MGSEDVEGHSGEEVFVRRQGDSGRVETRVGDLGQWVVVGGVVRGGGDGDDEGEGEGEGDTADVEPWTDVGGRGGDGDLVLFRHGGVVALLRESVLCV